LPTSLIYQQTQSSFTSKRKPNFHKIKNALQAKSQIKKPLNAKEKFSQNKNPVHAKAKFSKN
jgi:hypothetical protein